MTAVDVRPPVPPCRRHQAAGRGHHLDLLRRRRPPRRPGRRPRGRRPGRGGRPRAGPAARLHPRLQEAGPSERIIRQVAEDDAAVTFQFTQESRDGDRFEYDAGDHAHPGQGDRHGRPATCPAWRPWPRRSWTGASPPGPAATSPGSSSGCSSGTADLFPIRPQGGATSCPAGTPPSSTGCRPSSAGSTASCCRFPVPAGTAEGDRVVKEAVAAGLAALIAEHRQAVAEFGEDTRPRTRSSGPPRRSGGRGSRSRRTPSTSPRSATGWSGTWPRPSRSCGPGSRPWPRPCRRPCPDVVTAYRRRGGRRESGRLAAFREGPDGQVADPVTPRAVPGVHRPAGPVAGVAVPAPGPPDPRSGGTGGDVRLRGTTGRTGFGATVFLTNCSSCRSASGNCWRCRGRCTTRRTRSWQPGGRLTDRTTTEETP